MVELSEEAKSSYEDDYIYFKLSYTAVTGGIC